LFCKFVKVISWTIPTTSVMTWVKTTDALIRNVLKAYKVKGDVEKAADLINEVLLFRSKYKLNGSYDLRTDIERNLNLFIDFRPLHFGHSSI
jgi:hypothetical protein